MGATETGAWVLYLRKSKGRAGIARQRDLTTAHILSLGGAVAGEYPDTDRTAYQQIGAGRPERPGFDAMIAALRAAPGLGVAAWHADRLLRNPGDTETLIEVCVAGAHPVETKSGGSYDLSTANGRKRLRDDANAAAYEVDHMRERILAEKAEAAGQGLWLGGARPFGYEGIPAVGEDRKYSGLRIVEHEAALIRDAARAVLQGVSLTSIAAGWNARGIRGTAGGTWDVTRLKRMLERPRYAGISMRHGQETGPAAWPAILPAETFRALQLVFAGRKNPGYPTERRWLGSGIYLCGVCDAKLTTHGGSHRQTSYWCRGHVSRQAPKVDRYVSEFIVAWLERPESVSILAATAPPGEDTELLHDRILVLRGRLEQLTAQWMAGEVGDGERDAGRARGRDEIAGLEKRIKASARISPLAGVAGNPRIRELWPGFPLSRQRAILADMMAAGVMTVRVHPAGPGRPRGVAWPQEWLEEDLIEIMPGSFAVTREQDAGRDRRVRELRAAGLSYARIAAELGMSPSGVRRRCDALRRLAVTEQEPASGPAGPQQASGPDSRSAQHLRRSSPGRGR